MSEDGSNPFTPKTTAPPAEPPADDDGSSKDKDNK
jgi:hypothetical protein